MRGGTLYVVATPLGHLADLSTRAVELFRSVSAVAAEDTRRTRVLLDHLDAHPKLLSYHAHSPPGAAATVLRILQEGRDVALVSDSGTPTVSDPGASLVAKVRSAGFKVVPLPGPSAVAAALSASGLSADRYVFLGFLPRKGTERARWLERTAREELTTVLFEAPGRVGELLAELATVCGNDRRVVVARELTKVHETFHSGSLSELAAEFRSGEVRGECTIVLEGAPVSSSSEVPDRAAATAQRLLAAGVSRKDAISLLGELFGLSRNVAYDVVVAGANAKAQRERN